MARRFHRLYEHIAQMRESLWLDELYLKRRWYIVLMRILAIFWRGVCDNSLFNRAAALSYSSLLALAPILGVVVLLSGNFLRVNPDAHIKHALLFIAPSLEQYVSPDAPVALPDELKGVAAPAPDDAMDAAQKKEMEDAFDLLISHMVSGVRENFSGISKGGKSAASVLGAFVLIWMGLTLLIAIESAMNGIWGVKSGRAWGRKFVLYWSVLSLGILGALAIVGLSSATTFAKLLYSLPFGARLAGSAVFIGQALAVAGLTLILTFFYKFFPNTRVRFLPALTGGVVAALLLVANNMLSMMYISRVLAIQSLFGSMGIILVLMFGLYLFWAFLLLGGQLTYAVQNAQFLADQKAWEHASERTKETITFAAFVLVSRRFARCQPPLSSDEIAESLRVPANILNESIGRLVGMGLVRALDDGMTGSKSDRVCFTPAMPLKSVTFASFRNSYAALGAERGVAQLRAVDPLVDLYRRSMEEAVQKIPAESVETMLERVDAPHADGNPAGSASNPAQDERSSFSSGDK